MKKKKKNPRSSSLIPFISLSHFIIRSARRTFPLDPNKVKRVPLSSNRLDATPMSLGTLGTVLLYRKVVQWNKSLRNLWLISVHTVLSNQQKLESELGHQNKDLHSYEETANTVCMHQSSFCWSHLDYNRAVDAVAVYFVLLLVRNRN